MKLFDNLHDAPRGGGGAEVELLLRRISDLVGQPASSHLQVCDETRALACCKFRGTERNGCATASTAIRSMRMMVVQA